MGLGQLHTVRSLYRTRIAYRAESVGLYALYCSACGRRMVMAGRVQIGKTILEKGEGSFFSQKVEGPFFLKS